jgi:hypothetical protein
MLIPASNGRVLEDRRVAAGSDGALEDVLSRSDREERIAGAPDAVGAVVDWRTGMFE